MLSPGSVNGGDDPRKGSETLYINVFLEEAMNNSTMKTRLKKTAIAAAVVASLGVSASASAVTLEMSWSGLFTMLDPTGKPLGNTSNPYYSDPTWSYGLRTQISGTMTFDLNTGAGSGTVVPFEFFNGTSPAVAAGITLQAIGDGFGGPGTLVLGNMLFNWSGNNGIPVSIVLDAAGMYGALGDGFSVTENISGSGALPASNGVKNNTIQIGPAPVATTTWNTTSLCTVYSPDSPPNGTLGGCMGVSPSGALPLIADTIGGSPMIDGPFDGYNANFDVTSIHIDNIIPDTVVPVPAAVWLFGSGLLGLVGIARRKKKA
jgi:hypothetical protein